MTSNPHSADTAKGKQEDEETEGGIGGRKGGGEDERKKEKEKQYLQGAFKLCQTLTLQKQLRKTRKRNRWYWRIKRETERRKKSNIGWSLCMTSNHHSTETTKRKKKKKVVLEDERRNSWKGI